MAKLPILVLNSGSSSIKFSMYDGAVSPPLQLLDGAVDGIGATGLGKLWLKDREGRKLRDERPEIADAEVGFALVVNAIQALGAEGPGSPAAIGHRLVCGAPTVTENARVTEERLSEIERYASLAPLHTPIAAYIMRQAIRLFPGVPNFFCLDSYFHRTLPEVARRLPIPVSYAERGIRRIGAHGLSYESIVAHLGDQVPERMIIAHLGNGASISAVRGGRCVDTSMGLTPTGGLISGTRTGDLDPGVMLCLLRELAGEGLSAADSADRLERLATKQSGLLGLSELTNDMRALREAIATGNRLARLAVDAFVYSIRKFIGSYIAVLGGLDLLVFTGGIGENDFASRAEVCAGLERLGIVVDGERNLCRGEAVISAAESPVVVRVIPPAEDRMIVSHVLRLLGENGPAH